MRSSRSCPSREGRGRQTGRWTMAMRRGEEAGRDARPHRRRLHMHGWRGTVGGGVTVHAVEERRTGGHRRGVRHTHTRKRRTLHRSQARCGDTCSVERVCHRRGARWRCVPACVPSARRRVTSRRAVNAGYIPATYPHRIINQYILYIHHTFINYGLPFAVRAQPLAE